MRVRTIFDEHVVAPWQAVAVEQAVEMQLHPGVGVQEARNPRRDHLHRKEGTGAYPQDQRLMVDSDQGEHIANVVERPLGRFP